MKRRQTKIYTLDETHDGDLALKDITFGSVTRSDLERWFGKEHEHDTATLMGRVATLFRCVELRSQTIAGLPRQILDAATGHVVAAANFPVPQVDEETGAPLTEDNLPFTVDFDDLLWRTELTQCVTNESYWYAERNRVKLLKLRYLDPRTIKPVYSAERGVTGFMRTINGRAPKPLVLDDVAYFWRPGINESGANIGPSDSASRAAGIHNNLDKFLEMYFERGAIGKTLVFAESDPPEPEKSRIKRYLEQVLTGIGNAFGIEVLSGGMKVQSLTPPLRDLSIHQNVKDPVQREICVAYGVPLSLVFSDASNRAVSEQDDIHYYTKTIVPEMQFVAKKANLLLRRFGYLLRFRPDQLEVFQRMEAGKVGSLVQLFDRHVLTEDELRMGAGYEPRGADKPAAPTTLPDAVVDEDKALAVLKTRHQAFVARQDELRRWERKVLKRMGQARPYTIPFESDCLTLAEVLGVRRQLLAAETDEEVKAAFAAPFRQERSLTRRS
ncbi:MAG: phage portal protein [Anaerolinea sp.]|nr:phage portal protein [Anaerolinea sp.]